MCILVLWFGEYDFLWFGEDLRGYLETRMRDVSVVEGLRLSGILLLFEYSI